MHIHTFHCVRYSTYFSVSTKIIYISSTQISHYQIMDIFDISYGRTIVVLFSSLFLFCGYLMLMVHLLFTYKKHRIFQYYTAPKKVTQFHLLNMFLRLYFNYCASATGLFIAGFHTLLWNLFTMVFIEFMAKRLTWTAVI